mmetsp:Transcript_31902/g.87836  ORF Transcript_31902/g.87836 Transcript_31902/m.87836 type:complete len:98 (+) Transcript_31902:213-506(+)
MRSSRVLFVQFPPGQVRDALPGMLPLVSFACHVSMRTDRSDEPWTPCPTAVGQLRFPACAEGWKASRARNGPKPFISVNSKTRRAESGSILLNVRFT